MDEQRIGMMYMNLFRRWLEGIWDLLFPRGLRRSRWLPIAGILIIVALPVIGWELHIMGRFGALKREVTGQPQGALLVSPRPGGMDPIVLTRSQTPGSNLPQFSSVTLLPGLGMEVLQIRAFLPGKGEVDLMSGPTAKELADGNLPPRVGPNDRWGAIELPWSGSQTGVLTPVGTGVRNIWHGKTIETPNDTVGRSLSEGGMLNSQGADSTQVTPESSPTSAVATFKGTDFDTHWPTHNDVVVTVTLNATTLEIVVTAKNTGDQSEPMGIGWHPRFAIPSGERSNVELRLPGGDQMDFGETLQGIPTGKIGPASSKLSRFQSHIGNLDVDAIDFGVVHPKAGLMEDGIDAELRDPLSEFGLRLKALSDNVRELRVTSPAKATYVTMGIQTNFDDPLGKEWAKAEETIPTLDPGATMQWKVQLEIFPVAHHAAASR